MYTKAKIFNLALGALLLTKQVSDTETDTSQEAKVLNVHWDFAFQSSIQDMDLDASATSIPLELFKEHPVHGWKFAYKYPQKCLFLRRLIHHCDGGDNYYYWRTRRHKDTRATQIPRQVAIFQGVKVIFTNEFNAHAELILSDFPLTALSAPAGLAIAYKLAQLAAPLIAGKGAGPLRKEIQDTYMRTMAEAQQLDREENATFETPEEMSEFVAARLS
jgi:hypothetical protein